MEEVEKGRADFSQIGLSGLKRSGGFVFEEFLPQLKGTKAVRTYDEMASNDPIVGACLTATNQIVKQADWYVQPASDSPEDKEIANFVQECMNDMETPWGSFISSAMSMVTFGFSIFEVVYKRRNGNPHDPVTGSKYADKKIGWQNFGIRSQDSIAEWKFDKNGRATHLIQQTWPDFRHIVIPVSKCLHFRAKYRKDSPFGESSLRTAYRPWFFKKGIEEIEAMGVERDYMGVPTAWVPGSLLSANASDEEKQTLARIYDIIKNMRADKSSGLVLPLVYDSSGNKMFDFELMSSKGRRSHDTSGIISRYNRAIASSMLADFILIGHENVGSFALASSKTHLFSVAVGAYLDEIRDYINKFEIPRLLRLNGYRDVEMPELRYTDIETIDLDELASYVSALSRDAGMNLTGDNIASHLLGQAGIPEDEVEGVRDPTPAQERELNAPDNTPTPDGGNEEDV